MTNAPEQKPATSLSDIICAFYEDALKRFPQLKGRLLVVDVENREVHGKNELEESTDLTHETALTFVSNCETMQKYRAGTKKSSCSQTFPRLDGLRVIFFRQPDIPMSGTVSRRQKMHILAVLDHELGHLALRDGLPSPQEERDPYSKIAAECIADAYALIRHYQRFGANSTYTDKIEGGDNRLIRLTSGHPDHFTTFVTDEIRRRRHEIDFKALTPADTANLARRFALEFMPPAPVIKTLADTFAKIRKDHPEPEERFKATVDLALDPKTGYHAFIIAHRLLAGFLDGRIFFKKPLTLSQEYKDDLRRKLALREIQLEKQDILFNMPTKPATVSPNQLKLF